MFFVKKCLASIVPREWVIWSDEKAQGLRRVALTFDDGPNPEYTPAVLDILASYNIKASFFLLGREVERFKSLARRIIDEGHSIGNHSYSHRQFWSLSREDMEKEISRTQGVFKDLLKKDNRFFRPPQGTLSLRCLRASRSQGLSMVLWSRELAGLEPDSVRSGDILLFHDDNDGVLKIIPEAIEALKARGFEFVTIEEMLGGRCEYTVSSPYAR